MASINAQLTECIKTKDVAQVNVLLKAYADNPFNYERLDIDTALCHSIQYKCPELCRIFLSAKASVRCCFKPNGDRPIHIACRGGDKSIVAMLIKEGSAVDLADISGWYPLHIAVKEGHYDVAALLLEKHASPNKTTHHVLAETPLHLAITKGNHMMACLLIDNKADVNFSSKNKDTPLHYAAEKRMHRTGKYLLSHAAEVNCQNMQGATPLMTAVGKGHSEMVQLLLENGADINLMDNKGCTAVCYVVNALGNVLNPDNFEKIKVFAVQFLKENSEFINICNYQGFHPLFHAIDILQLNIVQVLVDCGADVNLENNKDQQTPLGFAVRLGALEIACYLVDQGADVWRTVHRNQNNFMLWNILIRTKGTTAHRYRLLKLFIENGMDLQMMDSRGFSLLDHFAFTSIAISDGFNEIIELVKSGAKLRKASSSVRHHSALCCCVWHGDFATSNFLVKCGWDLNSEDWIWVQPSSYNIENYLKKLQEQQRNPQTLLQISRQVIRNQVLKHTEGKNIAKKVALLPLPSRLCKFLNFHDEIAGFLQEKAQEQVVIDYPG